MPGSVKGEGEKMSKWAGMSPVQTWSWAAKRRFLVIVSLMALLCVRVSSQQGHIPDPPSPEPIEITELPLPPAAPSDTPGACTAEINPHRTGCVDTHALSFQSGSFLPDGRHVLAMVHFVGAPAAPDPASIYQSVQIILVKADDTKFSNGDPWKCITCGVPVQNAVGTNPDHSYPQSFADGKRILEGSNIVDCSPYRLTDDRCTSEHVHIYPIRWNIHPDGSGPGGVIRELRLHPDNQHIGFNAMSFDKGQVGQFGYIARLEFDPSPSSGEPRGPRYDLTHVIRLFRGGADSQVLMRDPDHPDQLKLNYDAITVGEFRGFSKDGREAFYIGYPWESCNIDLFAVNLTTGKVRRLTSNPEYADPLDASPDDRWIVVDDTRGSGRQMFMAAMRGVPPITDLLTAAAVSSVRNNGERRFFQPFLIDRYGDRDAYQGQQLNAGDRKPGSASDPDWNAMADPRWSPDGTRVAYWQAQVTSPACGGSNPLPCPEPTEPGGQRYRLMVARFTSRKPLSLKEPEPFMDNVPWGTPYVPGSPVPQYSVLPDGTYTLRGRVSGSAKVTVTDTPDHRGIKAIAVAYNNYSDDGENTINGTESVNGGFSKPTEVTLDWHSNLTETGKANGTKLTSPDGFELTIDIMRNIFEATGTLTTTINGVTYKQPGNGD
jgi:hypothetical protein